MKNRPNMSSQSKSQLSHPEPPQSQSQPPQKPPRLAVWLIERMFPDSGGCSVLGDMIETFRSLSQERGITRARFWFWGQCLKALPAHGCERFYWRMSMLRNYLLIAIRNIQKNKLYSFLNIFGLTVGLTTFILIALYVQFELSFDRYHEGADRIYRVVRNKPTNEDGVYLETTVTPAPLGPALVQEFPEVIAATRVIRSPNTAVTYEEKTFLEEEFYWADPDILKVFSLPFLKGDPQTALNDPTSIVLSERAALKYFGSEDPMGKTLTSGSRFTFNVTGIFADMPANSHFVMDLISPYTAFFKMTGRNIQSWGSNYSYTYLLLKEGTEAHSLEAKFPSFIEKYLNSGRRIEDKYRNYFALQALADIHLHSHRNEEITPNGDIIYVILFSSIAFLVLVIACLNYMNLATARSLQRGREVGIRKVVGAQRIQLVRQLLSESLVATGVAMILALASVILLLPAFNSLVERRLSFDPIANPQLSLGILAIVLVVGLLSGSYPALSISGFKPVSILSGSFSRSMKGQALRNALVLIQFSITIAFLIFTFVVRAQLQFIRNRDMGYSREHILTSQIGDPAIRQNIQAVKDELLQHSGIVAVATSENLPNNIDVHTTARWPGRTEDAGFPIYYQMADYGFVDLFEIKIVSGRNFSRDYPSDEQGAFLVNEAAVRAAQWENPIGQEFFHWSGKKGKIVGVMKDFHLHSLHRPIEPLYVFLDTENFRYLSIKIRSDNIPVTVGYIEEVIKKFSPGYPFEYAFFDDVFERAYHTERRMSGLFGSMAVLAIFIACLGLFGLAAFAADQRTKEIGVRKILGASESRIFWLFSKDFIRWVVFANFLAWPVAYFVMRKWLQNFIYRIDIEVGVFLLSGGLALLVALLTVSIQSLKSATANPVHSLRYE